MLYRSNAVQVFLWVLLWIPWLNPIASGPSPSVYPWLIAAACSILLLSIRSKLTASLIAWGWLFAALVSAAMGVMQYFGFAQNMGVWVHTAGLGDAFANLRQRNQFATLTSIGLVALMWFESTPTRYAPGETGGSTWKSYFSISAVLLLSLGNAASSSRTGMLQWCLIAALTTWWAYRSRIRVVGICALALGAYALSALALPGLLEQWTGTPRGGLLARFAEDPGCGSRHVLWTNVIHLIAQKPWTGWGWGELDYAHFVTLYPGERFCDILDNAHNLPLHLAVELGLPFAFVAIGSLAWWVWRNRPWAETSATRQMAWSVLAVIAVHSMLEYPLWYGPFQLAVVLSAGLLWCRPTQQVETRCSMGLRVFLFTALPKIGTWAVAPLCLVFLAGFGWDYWRVCQLYLEPKDRAASYRENTFSKVRDSWFFQDQVQFAALLTGPVERQFAAVQFQQATNLIHFSPEPRVIEAVIESAVMLGKDQEALYYLQRYQAAFPQEYAAWIAQSARFKTP